MIKERIELILDNAMHITEEMSLEDDYPNVTYSILMRRRDGTI